MSESTTRISDLPPPENIKMNVYADPNSNFSADPQQPQNLSYAPMNIHPNPYGNNSIQPNIMPHPQHTPPSHQRNQPPPPHQRGPQQHVPQQQPQHSNLDIQDEIKNMPQVRLPSRDIPTDQTYYQQDVEITPNYIPKPKSTRDYVREEEDVTEEIVQKHHSKKAQKEKVNDLFNDFQIPVLVSILYFIFQMPSVNTFLYKNFSFLSIHNLDGNINFYGVFFKSLLFGTAFYSIYKSTELLSNF
jgi:hypothetical protein